MFVRGLGDLEDEEYEDYDENPSSPFDISGLLQTALQTYATIETVKATHQPQAISAPRITQRSSLPMQNMPMPMPQNMTPWLLAGGFGLAAILLLRR